jgi:hypothetical protein
MRNGLAAGLLALALAGPAALADDGVAAAFEGYRQAVLEGRGAAAGVLVSADSRAFYDVARLAALDADGPDLDHLTMTEGLLALRLRAALKPDQLRGLDGGGVIAATAARGMIGVGTGGIRLAPAEIYGDHAVAEQLDGAGHPTGVWWRFVREDGAWRINLRPSLEAGDALLQARLQASGLSRADFLKQLATNGR